MTTRVSEVIRGWLGWCPQASALPPRRIPFLNNDTSDNHPEQGPGMPTGTRWLKRYRNQIFLWAVFYTLVFMPVVASSYSMDVTRGALYLGVIGGLGFFAFFGRKLWHRFNQLAEGEVTNSGSEDKVILAFVIGSVLLSSVLLVMGLLSIIPFEAALALPSFAMGFALIPWYVLVLILIWERRTGCILLFDKKTRSFTALKCSGNAFH